MTAVRFDFDGATAIPLPGADLGAADVDRWAAEAASRLAALHEFPSHQTETLARTLSRAQRSAAADASTSVLVFEPATRSWAPLRLTLATWEPDLEEQRRFLRPPAVLAPRLRPAVSSGLGEGCSSTLMDEDGRATVRWLFMTPGASFFAVLGPLEPTAVALSAARVEELLDSVRVGAAVWTPSDRLDVRSLVAPPDSAEEVWRV